MTNPFYTDPSVSMFHHNHKHALMTSYSGQTWHQFFDPEKVGPRERQHFQQLQLI